MLCEYDAINCQYWYLNIFQNIYFSPLTENRRSHFLADRWMVTVTFWFDANFAYWLISPPPLQKKKKKSMSGNILTVQYLCKFIMCSWTTQPPYSRTITVIITVVPHYLFSYQQKNHPPCLLPCSFLKIFLKRFSTLYILHCPYLYLFLHL